MNINSLKARVNNLVSKTNVPHNTIYKMHFFDNQPTYYHIN